jgi:hypothetical protein
VCSAKCCNDRIAVRMKSNSLPVWSEVIAPGGLAPARSLRST